LEPCFDNHSFHFGNTRAAIETATEKATYLKSEATYIFETLLHRQLVFVRSHTIYLPSFFSNAFFFVSWSLRHSHLKIEPHGWPTAKQV
jgi:hypothetical protein